MDMDGNTIYMPCRLHSEYERLLEAEGTEESGYGYGGPMKPKKKKPKKKEEEILLEEETDNVEDIKTFLDFKTELITTEDDGTFEGYGSVFNNTDLGNDVIKEGAFTKTLRKKGPKGVKLLYQHKADEPIGVLDEIMEDRKGLRVQGRLAMNTQKGKEVYELMKMGAIDGLSIGYRVAPKGAHYDEKGKRRMLKEVDLMEISAVTFPMNPRAKIMGVKGEGKHNIREWEEFLREAGGLSRSESKVIAGAVMKLWDQREVDSEQKDVINSITNLTKILKGD
jgi:HK97 family phage prohead protease